MNSHSTFFNRGRSWRTDSEISQAGSAVTDTEIKDDGETELCVEGNIRARTTRRIVRCDDGPAYIATGAVDMQFDTLDNSCLTHSVKNS